jgi:hypothetical protein
MNKALPLALAALLAIFAVVVFFMTPPTAEVAEPVELRVYTVPQEYLNDIHSSLRHALAGMSGDNSELTGRVSAGPNSTLVVTAPPRIHRGVEEFLEDLEGVTVPEAELAPISLTYWFIAGRPMKSGEPGSYMTSGTRSLEAVEPALRQIAASQGPTEFSLLERVQLTSYGHDRAENHGRLTRVEQRATLTARREVVGEVLLNFDGKHQLRSGILLKEGQFLVLGQSGFGSRKLEPFGRGEDSSDATLYYVMTSNLQP